MRARALHAVLALFALSIAGCDCGGTLGGEPCATDVDCATGLTCVDGRCRPTSTGDGGGRDAGTAGCIDLDRDGLCEDADCDDANATRGGAEACGDAVDNDCDGATDEGFVAICACAPGCEGTAHPPLGGFMPDETNAEGVIVDDDGALTLGRDSVMAFAVWIANDGEATVSKLDSRTGRELARYPSVGSFVVGGGDVRPGTHNHPSRTAVDQLFDAYVANRAHGALEDGVNDYVDQGSVTKFANRERDCIDRNANGVIETSRDLNGDGVIDLAGAEYVGVDDECVLWTATVAGFNAVPRALAIGLAPPDGFVGDVWVGLWGAQQGCRLDPVTGAVRACMDIGRLRPYGMAADAGDRIWIADRSGARRDVVGYIASSTMTYTPVTALPGDMGVALYGITVDGAGDVFIANDAPPSIWRYRLTDDSWVAVDSGTGDITGTIRGVATDEQYLWTASSHSGDAWGGVLDNRIFQHRLSDLSLVATHAMPTGLGPVGVGVSFDGSIWAICQGNNIAGRFEPTTGAWTEHPTGLAPYTYSDFMGFGLNVFAEPRGRYAFVVEGCASGIQRWTSAQYRAEIPAGTSVTVYARTAATVAELAAATYVGPFTMNPVDFTMAPGPLAPGRYLQVELRLQSDDRTAAPRVFGVDVAGACEPILE